MGTLDKQALTELTNLSELSSDQDVEEALRKAAVGLSGDWRGWHRWQTGAFPGVSCGGLLFSLAGELDSPSFERLVDFAFGPFWKSLQDVADVKSLVEAFGWSLNALEIRISADGEKPEAGLQARGASDRCRVSRAGAVRPPISLVESIGSSKTCRSCMGQRGVQQNGRY